ncbi:MAG: HisA/HisF-related TIM barrel protein [Archaeoglobaceae archaeon]
MDIMNGVVVLAERGERKKYRPVAESSHLVKSSDPIEVLSEIRPKFLYVADLDRIQRVGDNMGILKALSSGVEEIMADCGFRNVGELKDLNFIPVLGTETFDITEIGKVGKDCYVSFDFLEEKFLDASGRFKDFRVALEFLNSYSIRGIIVLNIKRVGSGSPDFRLLSEVLEISDNPVYLGGGVSGLKDLEKLKEMGCEGTLVSTGVHKKRIPLELIRKGFI